MMDFVADRVAFRTLLGMLYYQTASEGSQGRFFGGAQRHVHQEHLQTHWHLTHYHIINCGKFRFRIFSQERCGSLYLLILSRILNANKIFQKVFLLYQRNIPKFVRRNNADVSVGRRYIIRRNYTHLSMISPFFVSYRPCLGTDLRLMVMVQKTVGKPA